MSEIQKVSSLNATQNTIKSPFRKVKKSACGALVLISSFLLIACDGGSSDNTNISSDINANTVQQTSIEDNSYYVTITAIGGAGMGYDVGDQVLVQINENSIIIDDKTYSPYETLVQGITNDRYIIRGTQDQIPFVIGVDVVKPISSLPIRTLSVQLATLNPNIGDLGGSFAGTY